MKKLNIKNFKIYSKKKFISLLLAGSSLLSACGNEGKDVIRNEDLLTENGSYIVQFGDTLSEIANTFNVSMEDIIKNNEELLADNFDHIESGMELKIVNDKKILKGTSDLDDGFFDFQNEKNTDFVIFDIGNNSSNGVSHLEKKLDYCENNNIPAGIIISTNPEDVIDIYNDFELVRSIVYSHNLTYPVYLNINNIVENKNFSFNEKKDYIIKFMELCTNNKIYVGIYGTDSNLTLFNDSKDILNYDSYLVQDKNEITYKGIHHITEKNNKIISDVELNKIIEDNKLNLKENLTNNLLLTLTNVSDLNEIALKYDLSINDILKFNEIEEKDIRNGMKIHIPYYKKGISYKESDDKILGIDLSSFQGQNSDWKKISEKMGFVIIKCNEGRMVDSAFQYNAINCNKNNIPMGVYCFNAYNNKTLSKYDLKTDNEKLELFRNLQIKQAQITIDQLKNFDVTLPVYLDIESASGNLSNDLSKELVSIMLDVWYDVISSNGFIPGIYSNVSGLNYLSECYPEDLSDKFQLWIASGPQYGVEVNYKDLKVPDDETFEKYNSQIIQVTDKALNCGAGNGNGYVDANFSNVDYSGTLQDSNNEKLVIKEFSDRKSGKNWLVILGQAGIATLVEYYMFIMAKNKIKKHYYK